MHIRRTRQQTIRLPLAALLMTLSLLLLGSAMPVQIQAAPEKSLQEIEDEIGVKQEGIDSLVSEHADEIQLNTLYSGLAYADVQRALAERGTGPNAPALSAMSLFSAAGWVPVAVSVAVSFFILFGVSKLLSKIISNGMKRDFVK